jgi:hypothetical protein
MLYPKFMIYDNVIIVGKVEFHQDLLPKDFDMSKVYGGGMFDILNENKKIILYGKSEKFGRFCQERANSFPFEDSRIQDYERVVKPYNEYEEW